MLIILLILICKIKSNDILKSLLINYNNKFSNYYNNKNNTNNNNKNNKKK